MFVWLGDDRNHHWSIELISHLIDRLNILDTFEWKRTKNFWIIRMLVFFCMCVSTFRPVPYKYSNIIGMFAVTSMVHKYETETIWQRHSQMFVLSSETHASKSPYSECALMQPIFGYCILLMQWIVHEFSRSFLLSTKTKIINWRMLNGFHTLTMHTGVFKCIFRWKKNKNFDTKQCENIMFHKFNRLPYLLDFLFGRQKRRVFFFVFFACLFVYFELVKTSFSESRNTTVNMDNIISVFKSHVKCGTIMGG